MAVYPDKKDGKHTGRWRVEIQKGKTRYRQRHDSHEAAEKDEERVRALWAAGVEDVGTPMPDKQEEEANTFETVIPLAKGLLWAGNASELDCWRHLAIIASIVGPTTPLDAVDTNMVDDLVIKLKKLGKADGTVNRYLSHLKTFLTWAKSRKYRTAPVKGEDGVAFSWQNESVGRIRWITAEEEKALGEYFLSRKNPEAEAVWDLVQVAIETGCRRDELLTAELEQVTFSGRPRLHLWETKTDTPRTVPMREATAKKLRKLIKEGRMPGRRNLRSWWERAREHMGLTGDADFVFHACRHTCATRMVDADINVFVIKEWMGHKVIETTLRYAHVKPKNLEDALEKVGDYHSAQEQKAQKTAENDVPHNAPTSEGNGDLAIAA